MEEKYKNIHEELIQRCLENDRYAQAELYRLYSKAMLNVCYRITNDTIDAEDVLQDVFVSAFLNLGSYNGIASFGAWLKRIAINKSLNFIKKSKANLVPIEDNVRYVDENSIESNENNLSIDQIKFALKQLAHGYRVVFSLYLIEGYDHKEIAEILDITESTSKSQFNRAKKKIREIMSKEGNYGRQFGTAG